MIPTFRNEIEAGIYAERNKPLRAALNTPVGHDYELEYGTRAARAAEECRLALLSGDMTKASIRARSLSTILAHECPHLFETRERRAA
jgi:hypothetical protein